VPNVRETFRIKSPNIYSVRGLSNNTGINIPSKQVIGIEVEVENIKTLNKLHDGWSITQDGSLRNNGAEFISRPIPACNSPELVENLLNASLLPTSCFSPRTSIHVHMDFTDDDLDTVEDVITMYAVFERLFFKFVGKQRIKNIYCVPITETTLLRIMGQRGINPGHWQKYSALNAKPLESLGTLEFRHMHGTFDVRKVCIWIDLITRLKDYCVKAGTTSVRATIASMDDAFPFKELLRDIFGERDEYMKFSSIEDVKFTYESAKLALCKASHTQTMAQKLTSDSPFYLLRDQ
jgi:hypothetical protein